MQEIALSPEVIELVGRAALPVVEALDVPIAREKVARAARPALEELSARRDLPQGVLAVVRAALGASRDVAEGDAQAYGTFLKAIHEILLIAGLPAPCELAAE